MPRYYTHYWENETWDWQHAQPEYAGESLTHTNNRRAENARASSRINHGLTH